MSELAQKPNNRRTGLRGPDGRLINLPRIINVQDSDSDRRDISPAAPTASTPDYGKSGRGCTKVIHDRQTWSSSGVTTNGPIADELWTADYSSGKYDGCGGRPSH